MLAGSLTPPSDAPLLREVCVRILGIDPGSNATGYGVIERRGSQLAHVAHGTVRPAAGAPLAARLADIQRGIAGVISQYAPDLGVVEQVFVAANPRSALVLGQARGAILAAIGAAQLPVEELAAREIKQAVTGSGSADKLQVKAMVMRLLSLSSKPGSDASDALAAAICRAHQGELAGVARRPRPRSRRSGSFTVRRAR
jgi:crossover junction endodeoxyribonuclease RuvC